MRRVVSDPHDHGTQKNGKVDNSRMGTNPRSAGFEPRASIFRGACAAPSGKDDDIEGMSIVARWRHPFRQASFIVAVATLAAVSPTSPPSLSGPFMMQAQPTPLAPMPTCPACSPVRRCLCCRPAELCSGPSSPLSLPLHRCRLVISVYSHWGLPSLFSLGQLQPAVSGRHPLGSSPPPSPLNCLLLLLALSQEPGACV